MKHFADFKACIKDLAISPEVLSMASVRQHLNINCLEHCLFVSYVSYRICRFFRWNYTAAARGGLLHDLFLYNQYKKDTHTGLHINFHPKAALENANKICVLTEIEADCILKHMWPLTFKMPKFKESFVVNFADTICALAEMLLIYKFLNIKSKLKSALK